NAGRARSKGSESVCGSSRASDVYGYGCLRPRRGRRAKRRKVRRGQHLRWDRRARLPGIGNLAPTLVSSYTGVQKKVRQSRRGGEEGDEACRLRAVHASRTRLSPSNGIAAQNGTGL